MLDPKIDLGIPKYMLMSSKTGSSLETKSQKTRSHLIKNHNFNKFGLDNQIKKIINKGLDDLVLDKKYDLVIAEGFLNTMKNLGAKFEIQK